MKIRRFQGADVRSVLRQVRDALGPEAVILSNRREGAGVEIVAAADYDEASVWQAAGRAESRGSFNPSVTKDAAVHAPESAPEPPSAGLQEVREELARLKALLEERLDSLSWGQWLQLHPHQRAAFRELQSLELSPGAIREVLQELRTTPDGDQSRRDAMVALVQRLSIPVEDPLSQGGIIALVGTTGVGKTTTLAKLAARQVMARGPQSVCLVSSDGHRIGAHDQLITYGRLLGVGVHVAETPDELRHVLGELNHVPLVLVDSAGMGQRDQRLADQLQRLHGVTDRLRAYVVLPASARLEVLEQTLAALGPELLAGAMISKLDEAISLGPILSVLIRYRLGAMYLTNGQRVPEDLLRVRPADLVVRARDCARQSAIGATHGSERVVRAG